MPPRIFFCASAAVFVLAFPLFAQDLQKTNRYQQTSFVGNNTSHSPQTIEATMINAWGIVIRPAGAGGHFWVTAKETSFEYVGDVHESSDPAMRVLHTDKLKYVKVPVGGDDNFATGVVYCDSKNTFVVTQEIEGVTPITAAAKFIFASDGGIISAWTERKKADGSFDRSGKAEVMIDQSKEGAQFFGLAISANYDRLYAADFGKPATVKVFDGKFKPLPIKFDAPFDDNKNGKVDIGEYAPFNVQALTTPSGEHHIFVTYAKTKVCSAEDAKKGDCKEGELFAGEEDTSQPGCGRLAEFTEDGNLVAVWKDGGKLSAPWGLAYAPANFGALSNMLLVANFGDGSIAAFHPTTHEFVDMLRNEKGDPVKIEKIWGILFGNGVSLGDTNALYFAAGPNDEKDGLFGSLRPAAK